MIPLGITHTPQFLWTPVIKRIKSSKLDLFYVFLSLSLSLSFSFCVSVYVFSLSSCTRQRDKEKKTHYKARLCTSENQAKHCLNPLIIPPPLTLSLLLEGFLGPFFFLSFLDPIVSSFVLCLAKVGKGEKQKKRGDQ